MILRLVLYDKDKMSLPVNVTLYTSFKNQWAFCLLSFHRVFVFYFLLYPPIRVLPQTYNHHMSFLTTFQNRPSHTDAVKYSKTPCLL